MPCDLRVHQSLDADAHTRIFFSARHAADALEMDEDDSGAGAKQSGGARSLQHSRFKLALHFDVEVAHRDAMASYAGRIWPGSALLCRYIELEHERALAEGRHPPFLGKRIVELGAGCQSHTRIVLCPGIFARPPTPADLLIVPVLAAVLPLLSFSGAALPSLCCWLLGAQTVVATDMNEDGLAVLRDNIELVRSQVSDQQFLEQQQQAGSASAASSSVAAVACNGSMSAVPLCFGDPLPPVLLLGSPPSDVVAPDTEQHDCSGWDFVLGSYILYNTDSFPALARSLADLTGPATTVLLTSHEPTREGSLRAALAQQGLRVARRVPFSLQDAKVEGHALDRYAHQGTVPVSVDGSGASTTASATADATSAQQEPIGLRSTSILIVTRDSTSSAPVSNAHAGDGAVPATQS
jgi:predicted nicotinamide N-methyase